VFTLIATTSSPLDFADESYAEDGILSVLPGVFEFTSDQSFLLSVDGALPKLVRVGFPDTAQTELGFDDIQTAILPDLVGQNDGSATGTIGGDGTATFNVRVTQSNKTITGPFAVNVTEILWNPPGPNLSLAELNSDLIIALTNVGLNSLILSEVQGNKRVYRICDPFIRSLVTTMVDSVDEIKEKIKSIQQEHS